MKSHGKRSDSRFVQFNMRVPEAVRERVSGRVITVDLPAHDGDPAAVFEAKPGRFVRGSLHTRNAATADTRHLLIRSELAKFYAAAKAGPARLTQLDVEALSGEVYRSLMAKHGENPGSPRQWESFKALTRAALEGRLPGAPQITERGQSDDETIREVLFGPVAGDALTAAIDGLPATEGTRALEQRVGRLAYWTLQRHGVEVDDETRFRLLQRVAVAALDAGLALKRRAAGDYRPDPAAERFPPVQIGKPASGITLGEIFERWRREAKPAASTVTTWRGIVADFTKHAGDGGAARITDTQVVAWKDARVAAGRSAKTINDSDLACLRALFRFGIANKVLSHNPADGVKVSAKRRAGEGRLPYSNDDIARLLKHAEGETAAYRRWLPILLVTTGARVGELAQLSSDRVRVEEGTHVLRLEPAADGGSLKNEGSERTVPMHPALIASGFLDFARTREGPLFYGRSLGRGEGRHASKSAANRLAGWIRSLPGFDDERKAPAHSTRHWWKVAAVKAGIADSLADRVQGHTSSSAADGYRREIPLETL